MVEACFNRLTRVSNVEHVAYEDELSFFLLDFCTFVSKISTSSHWELNSILRIECLATNHKSSCMLARGYRKGDGHLSFPQIGTE